MKEPETTGAVSNQVNADIISASPDENRPSLSYASVTVSDPAGSYANHKVSDSEFYDICRNSVAKTLQRSGNIPPAQAYGYYNPYLSNMSSYHGEKNRFPAAEQSINPYLTQARNAQSFGSSQTRAFSASNPKIYTSDFKDISSSSVMDETKKDSAKADKASETAYDFMRKCDVMTIGSTFYVYDKTHYQKKSEVDIERLIVRYCREQVDKDGSAYYVQSIFKRLLFEDVLAKNKLEINHDVISFENGVLDLRDRILYQHSPSFFTINTITCKYNPAAKCPVFMQFLHQTTGGDVLLTERILQMFGYLLTTRDEAKVLFVLQGYSNTGKSILSNLIFSMFNIEAVSNLDIHDLENEFAIATLYEKVICISADLSADPISNKVAGMLKRLTGFDTVLGNVKYKDYLPFRNFAKFVLVTNHPLYTSGSDDALFERVVTIPFVNQIPKEQQDRDLAKKLENEKEGIVAAAIAAYFRLFENNYVFAGDYRLNEIFSGVDGMEQSYSIVNCIRDFVRNYIVADPTSGIFASNAYRAFVGLYGNIDDSRFHQHFGRIVKENFSVEKKRIHEVGNKHATSYFKGIRLRNEYDI